MSASLPLILSRVHNALASHTEHSLCVYVSGDGVNFDTYPTTRYGSSLSDLSNVLSDINTRLAIQVSNVYIQQAIDLVPDFLCETDLDTGYSVRIVGSAQDLFYSTQHYQRAAFIRADRSLVVWGDDEETTLASWNEIICRVQLEIPSTPMAGLPVDTPSVVFNPEDFIPSLSDLNEFSFLLSLPEVIPPDNFVHPSWNCWQEGGLGLDLQGAPSPISDTTSASTMDSPFTADIESMPPSYPLPMVYVNEEEETGSNASLDFSTTVSDGGVSDSSSSQCTVGVPQALAIGQEATLKYEEVIYIPQHGDGSDAAVANADVDQRSVPNASMRKRSRSDIATSSVPARLTVPLPYIDSFELGDEYVSRKFLAIAPAPAPPPASPTLSSMSTSTSASTPTLAPVPMPLRVPTPPPASPSPSTASASTSASSPAAPTRTPNRRATSNRRRAAAARSKSKPRKRFPCEYCDKTFSRLQDQQRHSATSCNASPNRSTVDCPECGAILSRLDAAQRHWRGHENPSCAPPEWVSAGRF